MKTELTPQQSKKLVKIGISQDNISQKNKILQNNFENCEIISNFAKTNTKTN